MPTALAARSPSRTPRQGAFPAQPPRLNALSCALALAAIGTTATAHAQPSGLDSPTPAATVTAVRAEAGADDRNDTAAALPTVTVKARAANDTATEGSGSYGAASATVGSKVPATLRETPQSVSVMTRQQLDDQRLNSLEQAMEQAPGITVGYAGTGIVYSFYSRGFTLDNFQFDGVSTQSGAGNYSQPDLALYDHVEILRGANGLLSGAGEPGGTVNLVRKRPLDEPRFSANASVGSWSSKRGEVDVTGPLNAAGSLRGRAVVAYEDKGFFYDARNSRKTVAYGVLEADLGARTRLTGGVNYQKLDTPMRFALPRYSNGQDIGLSRSTYLSADWNNWVFETPQLFAELFHRFNDDWHAQLNANWLRERSTFKYVYANGAIDPATGAGLKLAGGSGHYEADQKGIDATLNGAFSLLARRHALVLGANWSDRDNDGFAGTGWSFPRQGEAVMLDFDRGAIAEPATPHFSRNSNANTRQQGVYGVVRWQLSDSLRLITGARMSWYDYQRKNTLTGAVTSQYKQNREVTPYGGLVWDVHPDWSLYASYADIFRVQSNNYQADGTPLDPAIGANYELGLKGSLAQGRLNTSLALFRIDESNRAQVDPDYPDACPANPAGGACYINTGKVRSEGVEAEINGALTPAWQIAASYTYNTTEYLRDRAANGSPSSSEGKSYRSIAPRHQLKVWTQYRLPGAWQAWHVGGGVNLQSSTYASSTTVRAEQPGYALWNLSAGWQADRHWSLALTVNNVFDKRYYRAISTNFGNWYGEPRSVALTARTTF